MTRRLATTTPPYSGPNKKVLMSTLEIRHGNILFATGTTDPATDNLEYKTEILDLSLETSRHTINFPLNVAGATGDILCGHPTICGGVLVSPNVSVSDECYTLQHSDNGKYVLNLLMIFFSNIHSACMLYNLLGSVHKSCPILG